MATAAAKKTASQAVALYTVISPLDHGVVVGNQVERTRYEPGDEVELDAATAAPLLGHTVALKDATAAAKAGQ